MKFTAAGDCAIQKNLPKYYDGFDEVKSFIMRGDVRFCNVETNVCEDCFPAKFSGGTWLRTDRSVLHDLTEYGFNVATAANNHSMDFSYNGFLQTLENLKKEGLAACGSGRNLAEASAPVYIDTPNGRAAFISCVTTFSPGAEAGEQSRDFPGRPGINPLHAKKVIRARREIIERLAEIAEETGINAYNEKERAEGYLLPLEEGSAEFGDMIFKTGEGGVTYEIDEADMKRIETSVKDAAFQADAVVVSFHTHEIDGADNSSVPGFIKEFAHRCIDAGAHAVIGHGPHEIRPVEIYKGLPIFYSLGDFVLHLENCRIVPDDFYKKFGLRPDAGLYEVFRARTRDFTIGLQRQSVMMEAVVPYFEIEDGRLKALELMPVELGLGMPHSQIGWPRRAKDNRIIKRLSEMSNMEL